jgi:hypothetical protein
MATKRQTTLAKMNRERAVREKRARKQEKRDAAVAERKAAKTPEGLQPADDPGPAS